MSYEIHVIVYFKRPIDYLYNNIDEVLYDVKLLHEGHTEVIVMIIRYYICCFSMVWVSYVWWMVE